uniref:Uncharacterized protein n=1 Tax=Cacopsylla melanoneura TaxID=428564 RepID=A0A8D8U6D0_9HEMI
MIRTESKHQNEQRVQANYPEYVFEEYKRSVQTQQPLPGQLLSGPVPLDGIPIIVHITPASTPYPVKVISHSCSSFNTGRLSRPCITRPGRGPRRTFHVVHGWNIVRFSRQLIVIVNVIIIVPLSLFFLPCSPLLFLVVIIIVLNIVLVVIVSRSQQIAIAFQPVGPSTVQNLFPEPNQSNECEQRADNHYRAVNDVRSKMVRRDEVEWKRHDTVQSSCKQTLVDPVAKQWHNPEPSNRHQCVMYPMFNRGQYTR